jgi:hypothetical protein
MSCFGLMKGLTTMCHSPVPTAANLSLAEALRDDNQGTMIRGTMVEVIHFVHTESTARALGTTPKGRGAG